MKLKFCWPVFPWAQDLWWSYWSSRPTPAGRTAPPSDYVGFPYVEGTMEPGCWTAGQRGHMACLLRMSTHRVKHHSRSDRSFCRGVCRLCNDTRINGMIKLKRFLVRKAILKHKEYVPLQKGANYISVRLSVLGPALRFRWEATRNYGGNKLEAGREQLWRENTAASTLDLAYVLDVLNKWLLMKHFFLFWKTEKKAQPMQ